MTETMVWDLLERPLWFGVISIFFLGFVLYFKNAKERENFNERIILNGFSGYMLCQGFAELFTYIYYLCVPGSFRGFVFYGDYSNIGFCYELFYKLAWGIGYGGWTFFFLTFELRTKRTKYVLTALGITSLIVLFLVPYNTLTDLSIDAIISSYFGITYFIILLLFMKWSDMEFKAISSFFTLGFTFFGTASLFTLVEVKVLNKIPLFVIPLFMCIGGLLIILPIMYKPKDFSTSLIYWLVFGFATIGMVIFFQIYFILNGFTIKLIGNALFFLIVMSYVEYVNLKTIRDYLTEKHSPKPKQQYPNVLATFARPQKLTEEEVSVSKEKKICIVCKGKLTRKMYLCPECNTFYCNKCSDALTNIENACWVCDAPFDETKPVKKAESEEDKKVEIVEESRKKEKKDM